VSGGRPVTTASSAVETTYYGKPAIKAPHWRWLIIAYFFCGGIAGASFTIGTIANLVSRDRAVERAARYLAWVALIPCPFLLILDLGRPERFLNMLRIVKLKSPMSLGSWALSGFGVFATAAAALHLISDLCGRDMLPGLRRIVGILGLPFSIFLSGYTGLLLAATNIPVWWRAFPFLTPTFISSAYSTALACITLILTRTQPTPPVVVRRRPWARRRLSVAPATGQMDTAQRLARAEALCLVAEMTFLTTVVIRLGKIGRPLTSGRLGLFFWPVTYIGGLLAPLALQLSGPVQGWSEAVVGRRRLAALLTLAGGFSLRALMIFAGRESARRPEDYFEMTRGTGRASEQ
jgi:formate-dependent nitrite reductase membrane component NrfD